MACLLEKREKYKPSLEKLRASNGWWFGQIGTSWAEAFFKSSYDFALAKLFPFLELRLDI